MTKLSSAFAGGSANVALQKNAIFYPLIRSFSSVKNVLLLEQPSVTGVLKCYTRLKRCTWSWNGQLVLENDGYLFVVFADHTCGVSNGMSHSQQLFSCCFECGRCFESQTELWLANHCAKKKKESTSSKVNAICMFLVSIYKYMFLRDTLGWELARCGGGLGVFVL